MPISVALCTYNGGKFLQAQLTSIFAQSVPVNEIVICDDGSTDGTIEIINQFIKNYPGIISLHVNNPALGTLKNFEKAISLTTGDLIFLSDQDDVWYDNKVSETVRFFDENPKALLLFTDADLIDDDGNKRHSTLWEKWNFTAEMQQNWKNQHLAFGDLILNNNKITGATVCFRSGLKKNVIPIELPVWYWHDAFLGIHASANDGLHFLEKPLMEYRIHASQQVGAKDLIPGDVMAKANAAAIDANVFFAKLREKYPSKKKFIPKTEKSFIRKVGSKLKFYLKSIQPK